METVYIFWTGGWDSTYRVVELSRMSNIIVKPIYIFDPNRKSHDYELKAINKITELLNRKPESKSKIENVTIISIDEIPQNEEISNVAKMLKEENGLGIQHDWTARVALQYPSVEMCIEKALPSAGYTPIKDTLSQYATLIKAPLGGVKIDVDKSDKRAQLIFGNIILPIFEITEEDMLKNIKAWGYEDIMSNIWFCHNPIKGVPCGFCSPCHTKMESNMEFLLPQISQKRFKRYELIKKKIGDKIAYYYSRICRIINA